MRLKIDPFTEETNLKGIDGLSLLILSKNKIELFRGISLKQTDYGTEITLDKSRDIYFNDLEYFAGKSWVIDVRIVYAIKSR